MARTKVWNGAAWIYADEAVAAGLVTVDTDVPFARIVANGTGTKSTTSTTWIPIDATNLPFVPIPNLVVGDIIELELVFHTRNANLTYSMFDFEVDRPVSANIRANEGNDNGTGYVWADGHTLQTVSTYYTVTEAGTHGFRPVWRVVGGTQYIYNAASGTEDSPIYFTVRRFQGNNVSIGSVSGSVFTPYGVRLQAIEAAGQNLTTASFTPIDQGYRDLRIVGEVRGTTAAAIEGLRARLYNDATAIYDRNAIVAGAAISAAQVSNSTVILLGDMTAATSAAASFTSFDMTVFNYASSTKWKNVMGELVGANNGAPTRVSFGATWKSTAPVTRVDVFANAGDLASGSKITLFGVKDM